MTDSNAIELYARFHQFNTELAELPSIVKTKSKRVSELLELTIPWSHWYQIPWKHSLSIFLVISGLDQSVIEASRAENPTKALFDLFDSNPDPLDDEVLTDEEKAFFISLFLSIMYQMESLSIFSQTMSDLVAEAKSNDEALLDAVIVDRSVVSCPVIAKRIQLAQLQADESFMNKLAKALTKTRPRRPNSEYDDLRYMLLALEDMKEYSSYTVKEKYELLAGKLELIDAESMKDAFEAFKKIERRSRERRGTSK